MKNLIVTLALLAIATFAFGQSPVIPSLGSLNKLGKYVEFTQAIVVVGVKTKTVVSISSNSTDYVEIQGTDDKPYNFMSSAEVINFMDDL
jgi:hypothetical protein